MNCRCAKAHNLCFTIYVFPLVHHMKKPYHVIWETRHFQIGCNELYMTILAKLFLPTRVSVSLQKIVKLWDKPLFIYRRCFNELEMSQSAQSLFYNICFPSSTSYEKAVPCDMRHFQIWSNELYILYMTILANISCQQGALYHYRK
jgi:hypothetical protein